MYINKANDILISLSDGKYDFLEDKSNSKFFDFEPNDDFKELTKNMKQTNKIMEHLQKEEEQNSEIKSNNSNRINISNKENISKNKNKDIISNDLNEFMGYIQDNLIKQNEENKLMMSKIIKDKEKDCANEKELYNNFRNIKQTNEDLNIKINANENKIKLLKEQLNELNEYKNIIKTMKQFKCKNCSKIFKLKDFINHIKLCREYLIINF